MTMQNPATGAAKSSALASTTLSASRASSASRPWRTGAFLLAGAAQLITISALLSVDPITATWAALLLAIAPAPLAAAAAFTPAPIARLAALATAAVLVAGIAGAVLHTGLFFAPALVVLIVGGVKLWREQA
jgi:hypothetical protein